MAARPERPPLPKTVWLLGWVSLFADIASEMVYPLIPVYLTVVLKAPVQALGFVEGFAESIVSFMKGASGWHSDRTGKRVGYVQLGYGLSAFGKPLMALAQVGMWPVILLARSLDRFGKGVRTTARDALIADSVDRQDYGRAFGLHRTMDTFGAFLGGVLAIILLELIPNDLRKIFLIAFLPGLASTAITFLLKDRKQAPEEVKAPNRGSLKDLPPAYWRAVVITLVFGLANSSDTFLLLRANNLFGGIIKRDPNAFGVVLNHFTQNALALGAPLVITTFAYILYNICYVAISYPAGKASDKIGRWKVIGAGYVLYAIVYAGFGLAAASWLWVLFPLYGLYQGLTDGVGKALVADYAPVQSRGAALGFFYMASGFMTLIGNIVAGSLWDHVGPQATFFFGSGLAVVALLLIPITGAFMPRRAEG